MAHGATLLAEIAGLASPAQAPPTIRFSDANVMLFQHLRQMSFPGHHAQERGGTLVVDKAGRLALRNIGGLGSTAGTFTPDLATHDKGQKVVGTFHTHPYDQSDGAVNGVSFSGADMAHLINNKLVISVVQSGPRLFAFLRTARSPLHVDYAALNQAVNMAIGFRVGEGGTFQQASRIEAQVMASTLALGYYQGMHGTVTRVYPA